MRADWHTGCRPLVPKIGARSNPLNQVFGSFSQRFFHREKETEKVLAQIEMPPRRLTIAFSKKIENHNHAIELHFMHDDICRIHQTLRSTPAMKADVRDHVWTIEEMVGRLRVYNLA
jgi:hypothetical protein